jgi:RsiW-degrading membrane proteinase PrsW (M82 family)
VYTDSVRLSQLCSILGHVAIKHIVHLEIIEAAWKRKKRKADGWLWFLLSSNVPGS